MVDENVTLDVGDAEVVASLVDESDCERICDRLCVLVIILIEKLGVLDVVGSLDFVSEGEYCGQIELGIVRPWHDDGKANPFSVTRKVSTVKGDR